MRNRPPAARQVKHQGVKVEDPGTKARGYLLDFESWHLEFATCLLATCQLVFVLGHGFIDPAANR